jgi:transcriptional regulator with XRE-family HTH domain
MNHEENLNTEALELSLRIIETIKKVRKEKGLSQADVADACNIPQPTYSAWERGKQDFPLTKLLIVMKFLDIKAFEESSKEEPKEDIAIVIKPEEIGDYFKALILNDLKQQQSISNMEATAEKQQQDLADIKQMLQELLQKKAGEDA